MVKNQSGSVISLSLEREISVFPLQQQVAEYEGVALCISQLRGGGRGGGGGERTVLKRT